MNNIIGKHPQHSSMLVALITANFFNSFGRAAAVFVGDTAETDGHRGCAENPVLVGHIFDQGRPYDVFILLLHFLGVLSVHVA